MKYKDFCVERGGFKFIQHVKYCLHVCQKKCLKGDIYTPLSYNSYTLTTIIASIYLLSTIGFNRLPSLTRVNISPYDQCILSIFSAPLIESHYYSYLSIQIEIQLIFQYIS